MSVIWTLIVAVCVNGATMQCWTGSRDFKTEQACLDKLAEVGNDFLVLEKKPGVGVIVRCVPVDTGVRETPT